jgi:hypothetical protein
MNIMMKVKRMREVQRLLDVRRRVMARLRRVALLQFLFSEQWGRSLRLLGIIVVVLIANFSWYSPGQSYAGSSHLYLFWDPANGAIPTGWTLVTAYNGYFPYGAPDQNPSIFGALAGTAATRPYTPTATGITVAATAQTAGDNGGGAGTSSALTHINPVPTITFGADTSSDTSNPDIAAFRSLQLMTFTAGIPNVIPQYAIVMFGETLPTTGFTRVSANDSRLIKIDSTVANGGSDSETNTVTVSGMNATAANTSNRLAVLGSVANAPSTHTHAPPAALTCTSGCTGSTTCTPPGTINSGGGSAVTNVFSCTTTGNIPPYIQPILGMATTDIASLSVALTGIFDNDPGAGWVVLSNTGGVYYHKYLRPDAAFSQAVLGSTTRTSSYSATSGAAVGASPGVTTALLPNLTTTTHNHGITFSTNALNNDVPTVNVVIAEKVSFTLNAYRWYVDTATTPPDVTDPWPTGSVDIAQDTALPITPAPYKSPEVGTQMRLRIQIQVNGQPLTANSTSFKLQYQKTSQSNCLDGTWVDVGTPSSSTDWVYGTSAISDGAQISNSRLTPTAPILQTYSKSASGALTPNTPTAAGTGQSMEFDWVISDKASSTASDYFIRPVENVSGGGQNSGTPLSLYTNSSTLKAECPEIYTKPGTDQLLRHGEFFLTNPGSSDPDQGFLWND